MTADIDAANATGGFTTDYSVSLRDGLANRISGATVTISNASLGTLTLVETGASSGDYASTRVGFPAGDFRLDVTRGADNVRNVNLGGPGVHTISAPVNGSVATAGQPLVVTWSVPSKAKAAELETRDFGPIVIADLGTYTIAGANNPANGSQRIRVRRYNEVDIAGGLPGSRLRVAVKNTVEPVNVR
ncbi:MAG: hypothetical protein ABIV10_10740 [Gemmatimonadaceae bacterium]